MIDYTLHIWTIYFDPSDFPGLYVARKFNVDKPTKEFKTAKTLEEIRLAIPQGLFCIPADPSDDPVIVESWL